MSLVLNTNNQGDGWFLVSNSNLVTSPDFKNSILISPNSTYLLTAGSTIATNGEVLSVNWTLINWRSGSLVAPDYYTAEVPSDDFKFWLISASVSSCEFRVWLNFQFIWWEIIWKNIFGWCIWFYHTMSWNFDRTINHQLDVSVKILHSDWTTTTVGDLQRTWTSQWSGNITAQQPAKNKIKGITTAGVVAVAGDRVVVDYKYTCTSASSTQYTTGFGALLGKKFTRDDTTRMFPVQISFE